MLEIPTAEMEKTEKYETTIGSTIFTVVSKYIGDKTYLDFIKAAVKRDVETALHYKNMQENKEKEAETLDF